jgi:serine/threonine-protein kinase
MGSVYRGYDENLRREVAVKVLADGQAENRESRIRFHREALALSQFNHPNIVSMYDSGSQSGIDFFVMEYIKGETLSSRLQGSSLADSEVLYITKQIAAGLEAVHDHGFVHLDIKPGNILLTAALQAKVTDFGLARQIRPSSQTVTHAMDQRPREAVRVGTLPYMSPEQMRGEPGDSRSDIWGMGCTLYEMATGYRPFRISDGILHENPLPPQDRRPSITTKMQVIILRCLEKDPNKRYQSARELAADLHEADIAADEQLTHRAYRTKSRGFRFSFGWRCSFGCFVRGPRS